MHGTPGPYSPPPPGPPLPGPRPPRARHRGPRLGWIVAGAVAALLVLGGLAAAVTPGEDEHPAAAATSSPTSAPAAPSRRAVPRLTNAQARAYLAALARIDPGLVADRERALRRARNICDYGLNHSDGMPLPRYVVAELSGGNTTIDERQARQVIRAVKVWCR